MRRTVLLACIAGAMILTPALAQAQRQPINCQTSGQNLYVRDVMTEFTTGTPLFRPSIL